MIVKDDSSESARPDGNSYPILFSAVKEYSLNKIGYLFIYLFYWIKKRTIAIYPCQLHVYVCDDVIYISVAILMLFTYIIILNVILFYFVLHFTVFYIRINIIIIVVVVVVVVVVISGRVESFQADNLDQETTKKSIQRFRSLLIYSPC